ncbi:MAG: biotin--[Bacteroidales bacterium]|nr:biotin--[acetyl-CoA-carboxylase] ligase [Bacteroidales bacterium]
MTPRNGTGHIYWYESIDSTNLEVRRRIAELDNLSVIAARFQTAGRGQGSHTWISPEDENLTFTVLLRFANGGISPLPAQDVVRITQMATLAIFDFLKEEGIVSRIKWPNDIWVGDRKICGMLIENILDGSFVFGSIVGIGLNLNQKEFDPSLPNPVSLSQLTGRQYPVEETLQRVYENICRQAVLLDTPDGRCELEKRFSQHLFHLDRSRQEQLSSAIEDFEANR